MQHSVLVPNRHATHHLAPPVRGCAAEHAGGEPLDTRDGARRGCGRPRDRDVLTQRVGRFVRSARRGVHSTRRGAATTCCDAAVASSAVNRSTTLMFTSFTVSPVIDFTRLETLRRIDSATCGMLAP